jgi:hypothetical protein
MTEPTTRIGRTPAQQRRGKGSPVRESRLRPKHPVLLMALARAFAAVFVMPRGRGAAAVRRTW